MKKNRKLSGIAMALMAITLIFTLGACPDAVNPDDTDPVTPDDPGIVPSAPVGFNAVPGDKCVILSWSAPVNNGGSEITGYQISGGTTAAYSASNASWVGIPGSGMATTSFTVTELTNGTSYTFEVRAVNANGAGASSGIKTATPALSGLPGAPGDFVATEGMYEVELSWSTPDNGGSAIIRYQISWGYANGYVQNWQNITGSGPGTRIHTVTGLTQGTNYNFEIRAVNSRGNGASSGILRVSTLSKLISGSIYQPSAPQNFTTSVGESGTVTLSWTKPSSLGATHIITTQSYRYEVSYGPTVNYSDNWVRITGSNENTTSHTVTGLTSGVPYIFRVRLVRLILLAGETYEGWPTPLRGATPN